MTDVEQKEVVSTEERQALDSAKSQLEAAESNLQNAKLQAENAELKYRYMILQVFYSHNMTEKDALTKDWEIVRNNTLPTE